MLSISEIRYLHIEFSTICNARCPLCPRNLYGFPLNYGYEETNLSLALIKKSLTDKFIRQLTAGIHINGNFGDFVSNPESLDIIRHFRQVGKITPIRISTNGSARNDDFWNDLGNLKVEVSFCLDGLEDTHHLYRQDTNWNKILHNAKTFIAAGGIAIWKMIKFDHNVHQIQECKKLSEELGFSNFNLVNSGRDTGPVFDRKGNFSHSIGKWDGSTDINELIKIHNDKNSLGVFDKNRRITCEAKYRGMIYISAEGKVYPCCWTGFSPGEFKNRYFATNNKQIEEIMKNNSLHEHDLETCIEWFKDVESSWNKKSYQSGLIRLCDRHCGHS
jgi:MoaA/NifB/PqqE/SkfB family radical SAM enzyme